MKKKIRLMTMATLAAGIALSGPSAADPPAGGGIPVPVPPVFCFRITDIEKCPDDISGAAFNIEFEVLNWTDAPACGLVLTATPGLFIIDPWFLPKWHNGVPTIVKAWVDPDGRGGPLGGADIGPGVFDVPAIQSGRGRGDLPGLLNDWFVDFGLSDHDTAVWCAPGLPLSTTSCIPFLDLLGPVLAVPPDPAASFALVPGLGTDGLGDSAIDGGPPPYTPAVPAPPFPTAGGPPVPDGSGNVLDGFVITVCDWHPGEILALNWFLLGSDKLPIGTSGLGNAMGFGTVNLIRLPGGTPPPAIPVFGGNTGFLQGPPFFFDGVWSVPCPDGTAVDFAVEFGAAITAPFLNGGGQLWFQAQSNTDVNPPGDLSDWHPCTPSMLLPPPCVGDIAPISLGGNGVVNIDDLIALLGAFGPCP